MPLFTLGMFLSLLFGFYLPIPLHVILPLHYFTVIALILSFYAVKQRPLLSYFSLGVLLGTLVCSLFSTGFYQYDFIKGQNSQYQINGEITNNQFPVDCSINKPVCLKTLHLKPIEIDSVKVKHSFFSPILAVRTDQFDLDIQKGNIVSFTAKLNRPLGYENSFGFNYAKWAFSNGIYAKGKTIGPIEVIDNNVSFSQQLINSIYSETEQYQYSEYFYPLLFAENKTLSSEQKEYLQINGLSHLFAISGLHIGILYILATYLFKTSLISLQSERKFILIRFLSISLVWGYVCLISFPVPATRAAILLSIWLLLTSTNLNLSKLNIFCLMVTSTFMIQPTGVLDVSWWLSVWAIAGIFIYHHHFVNTSIFDETNFLYRLKAACYFQWFLGLWLVPVSIFWFHGASAAGFWLNLILIPIFCILLIPSLFAASLFSILNLKYLSSLIFQISEMIFFFNEKLINILSIGVQWLSLPKGLVILVATITIFVIFRRCLTQTHLCAFAGVVCSLFLSDLLKTENDKLKLYVFDVGQGTSVLLSRNGQGMLYDLGPVFASGFSATDAVVAPNLLGLGIKQLDHVIISHSDSDHLGDIDAIKDFTSTVYSTSCPTETIVWQQTRIKPLWPKPAQDLSQYSDNDASCVLKVTDQLSGFSVLLTGDITNKVEAELVRLHFEKIINLTTEVIFSPHHGSKHSSSYPFLKATKATHIIHTAGVFNHFMINSLMMNNINIRNTVPAIRGSNNVFN